MKRDDGWSGSYFEMKMGLLLSPAGTALQTLGLSLVIGGMLVLGAFVAPVIFRSFPHEQAGEALTTVFRRYDKLLLAALAIILAGEALRFASGNYMNTHWISLIRYGLLLLLSGGLLFSTLKVNADIEAMQKAGIRRDASAEGLRFTQTHHLSEQLYKWEVLGAILVLALTPFVPLANMPD